MTPDDPAARDGGRRRPGWQVLALLVVLIGLLGATIWFGVR